MATVYVLQPLESETELLRRVLPSDTDIPVLTASSLVTTGKIRIGDEEVVTYSGITTGTAGEQVLQNCRRGQDRDQGGSEARDWPGGTRVEQIPWTTVERTSSVQPPTVDQIGRLVVFRQTGFDDTLNTGITLADGTPIWVELTSRPVDADTNPYYLAWVSNLFAGPSSSNGLTWAPDDVGMDSSGNLFVFETTANRRIQKFTSALAYSTKVGANGTSNGQFSPGTGYNRMVVAADTNVYVGDTGNNRIQKFTNALVYSTQWGVSGSPGVTDGTEGNLHFQNIGGIAADSSSNIYVLDRSLRTVKKYTSAGAYVTRWGGFGNGNVAGKFDSPTAIAVDPSNNVWVADTASGVGCRIQKFTSAGVWVATYIVAGTGNGQFSGPIKDIEFGSNGWLWVADGGGMNVTAVDVSTGFSQVGRIGGYGSGNGQYTSIEGIGISTSDPLTIFTADSGKDRIVRLIMKQLTGDPYTITVRQATSGSIANNGTGNVTATCVTGEICTGGGFSKNSAGTVVPYYSFPNGNGWVVAVENKSGVAQTVTAYAVCMKLPVI